MDSTEILKILISSVVGGVIATFLKAYFDKKKDLSLSLNRITEEKYKSLLVFMACAIDIEKKRYFTLNEQVPNLSESDYLNQIKEYYYHSILYSSDEVIKALKNFIDEPNQINYVKAAKAMRSDLWKSRTKLTYDDIKLD